MKEPNRFLRGVKPKELRDLYQKAADLGCTVELTASKHVKVILPDGQQVFGSYTCSDRRGVLANRSVLRRYGLDI